MGAAIVDEFDLTNGADSFEEFFEVVFGGVIGEVADVETGSFYFGGSGRFFAWTIFLISFAFFFLALVFALIDTTSTWCASGFLGVFVVRVLSVVLSFFLVVVFLRGWVFIKSDGFEAFLPKGEGLFARSSAARGLQFVAFLAGASAATAATATVVIVVSIASVVVAAVVAVSVSVAISVTAITAVTVSIAIILILVLFRHCLVLVRSLEPEGSSGYQ